MPLRSLVLFVSLFLLFVALPRSEAQSIDRAVTAVTLDRTVFSAGETLNATVTFRNLGTLPVGYTIVQIGLGTIGSLGYVVVDFLAPGGQMEIPFSVQIPSTALRGNYTVDGCAYGYGSDAETNFTNNCFKTPITIESPNFIDVRTVSVTTAQTSATQLVQFPVDVTVTNQGNVPVSTTTSVMLSTDAAITPTDVEIGYNFTTLAPGESRTVTIQAMAPENPSQTSAFLGACISAIIQTDYSNDCAAGPPITLINMGPGADLFVVGSLVLSPATIFEGAPFTASVGVYNDGPAEASNFNLSASWKPADVPNAPSVFLANHAVDVTLKRGERTTRTLDLRAPAGVSPGLYQVTFCVDPDNRIFERSETNNCATSYPIRVDGRRDYEITSVTPAIPNVYPGQQSTLIFTARNNGFRYEDGTDAHAVWSDDDQLTALDSELSMTDFGKLFSTETTNTWTVTLSLPVPFNASLGIHYVGVCVDWFQEIEETNETNNCLVAPVNVVPKPPSNSFPVVERVAVDAVSALPGERIQVTFRVANPGNLETQSFNLLVSFMSNAPVLCGFGGCQSELVLTRSEPGIPARGSRLYSAISLEIPSWVVPTKDYYVVVSAVSAVSETSTASTSTGLGAFRSSSLPLADDLVQDSVISSVPDVSAGLSVSIFTGLRNRGTGFSNQSTRTSIRWSRDNALDAGDPEIAEAVMTDNLDANLTRGRNVSLTVPPDAAPGTNYIFTCADSTDIVYETDENNCASRAVVVRSTLPEYKDLVVEGLGAGGITGNSFQMAFTVRNTGTVSTYSSDINASRPWWNYIRWSTDSRIDENDPLAAMFTMDRLDAGDARTFTKSLEVPQGIVAGTYFIGVCIDSHPTFNQVHELDEVNNCSSIPFDVSPPDYVDLWVSNVVVQAGNARPGESTVVSFRVANSGNSDAASFLHSITWSASGTSPANALWIRRFGWGGLAAASIVDSGAFRVDVPANAREGTYLVGICADVEQKITETDEGNNCGYATITVGAPAAPGQLVRMSMPPWGSAVTSTLGAGSSIAAGFAYVELQTGVMPHGAAVISIRSNGVTVSEVGVPSSPPTKSSSLFVEWHRDITTGAEINSGVAIANPGSKDSQLNLSLRGPDGSILVTGSATLKALGHVAYFVNGLAAFIPGFTIPPGFSIGSLEVSSSEPVSVMALRFLWNQRGESVMSNIPVADLTQPATAESAAIPLFADGGGFTSSLVLRNTSSAAESGQIRFRGSDGSNPVVQLTSGENGTSFSYAIPAGGIATFVTKGAAPLLMIGSVEVVPSESSLAPHVTLTFRLTENGVVVSEASVPATPKSTSFRLFADVSGGHDTGVAISNPHDIPVTVIARLNTLDNQSVDQTSFTLPPHTLISRFVTATFASVPASFKGQMTIDASYPLNVLTIRGLRNERGEFLMTALPAVDSLSAPTPLVFPQIADGGGFKTEIITINADRYTGSSSIIRMVPDGTATFSLPAP